MLGTLGGKEVGNTRDLGDTQGGEDAGMPRTAGS